MSQLQFYGLTFLFSMAVGAGIYHGIAMVVGG